MAYEVEKDCRGIVEMSPMTMLMALFDVMTETPIIGTEIKRNKLKKEEFDRL